MRSAVANPASCFGEVESCSALNTDAFSTDSFCGFSGVSIFSTSCFIVVTCPSPTVGLEKFFWFYITLHVSMSPVRRR